MYSQFQNEVNKMVYYYFMDEFQTTNKWSITLLRIV